MIGSKRASVPPSTSVCGASDPSACTTMRARSHLSGSMPEASVNSTCWPVGQKLGPVCFLAFLDAHDHLRDAAVGRHTEDAFVALTDEDPVFAPTHAIPGADRAELFGVPPVSGIRRSVRSPAAKKATDFPSGENTGLDAL